LSSKDDDDDLPISESALFLEPGLIHFFHASTS
jgi:hypothetical protein